MVRRAIVLAAGRSTRIAPLSQGIPKPLMELNGEPVLIRNLRWLAANGIQETWINLHYRPELIRARVGNGAGLGMRIFYSYERDILGTAGGVRKIAAEWNETFLVVYGDNLIRANLKLMLEAHQANGALITIAIFDRKLHSHTGLAGGSLTLKADGTVASFNEGMPPVSSQVNAGLYLLEREALVPIPAGCIYDFARDLFPRLLECSLPINSHAIEGYCLGIDTPDAYREAQRLIEQGTVELI
jgi:NDP-sugar pyrophosphorylase family protein